MNFFKKAYCRTFQTAFKIAMPFLPYREPKILKSETDVASVLKKKNISTVLLVTDKGLSGLGLTKSLESTLSQNNIKVVVYDEHQKGFCFRRFNINDLRLLAECVYSAKFISKRNNIQR